MNPNEFSRHLRRMNDEVRRAVNSDIPKKVAAKAVSLFKQNFQDEGFFGRKWKDVQRRQTHTVSYKTKSGVKTRTVPPAKGADGQRRILTGRTGDLGRSIRWKTEPGRAVIYSDLPYAAAHNDVRDLRKISLRRCFFLSVAWKMYNFATNLPIL